MCWVIQALLERETRYNVFPHLVAGRKVREKGPGDEVVTQPHWVKEKNSKPFDEKRQEFGIL